MNELIEIILHTENLRTIVIIFFVVGSHLASKTTIQMRVKALSEKVENLAELLRIRVEKKDGYRKDMMVRIVEGISDLTCETLRDIAHFKLKEFHKAMMEIHDTSWSNISPEYVRDIFTGSIAKVDKYFRDNVCEEEYCYNKYIELHVERTEVFIEEIAEIIREYIYNTQNGKRYNGLDDKLHDVAMYFITRTLLMFYKIEGSCPKLNKEVTDEQDI